MAGDTPGPDPDTGYEEKARALKREGWAIRAIAEHLGLSRSKVGRVVKGVGPAAKSGPKPEPGEEPDPSQDTRRAARDLLDAVRVEIGLQRPGDVEESWARVKQKLANHPAVTDPDHLLHRMRRLIDSILAQTEARLDTASTRELVGALKYLVDCYIALSGWDNGTAIPKSLQAIQVNVQQTMGAASGAPVNGAQASVGALPEGRDERLKVLRQRLDRLGLAVASGKTIDLPARKP
ncbi:MAG: hypothetical protein ABIL09_24010 [Gemmatimonadota bacterium]